MDWITEHIALGGAEDLERLEAGFDAILCCTMPGEIKQLGDRHTEFLKPPFTESGAFHYAGLRESPMCLAYKRLHPWNPSYNS